MFTLLVVDDSSVDRQWVGSLLEQRPDWKVAYAPDGRAAVESMGENPPDLVLTDLQMPLMNGLELVEHIRATHPFVPVVLMTAHGSEQIAIEALKKGAASYVPKRALADDLVDTVEDILTLAKFGRDEQRILACLTQTESHFKLENDQALIAPLIGYLEKGLKRMDLCDATGCIRVTVALQEALVNAMDHGNLEVPSHLKETGGDAYMELVATRRRQPPYASRHVHVTTLESRSEVVYIIRDEGAGFDPALLPDPTDPANLDKASGRGLLLIRNFMDEVHHHDGGRELRMTLRKNLRQ